MTAIDLLSWITRILFVVLFLLVAGRAIRRPLRGHVNTAILFGSLAALVVLSQVFDWLGMSGEPWTIVVLVLLLNLPPYVMVLLVDDFSRASPWPGRIAAALYLVLGLLTIVEFGERAALVEAVSVFWYLGAGGYAAIAFLREAASARGITRRRMLAVAIGSILLVATIALALASALLPAASEPLGVVIQVLALLSALAYFGGFSPPRWLRRAWQEPELLAFLSRGAHLRSTDRDATIAALERDAARAMGSTGASIGLWQPATGTLVYRAGGGEVVEFDSDELIAGRAFTQQRPIVSLDAGRDDPEHAAIYNQYGATAVIAAPITSDDRRWGVLGLFAARPSIFVEDDLRLIQLLAEQIAMVLESLELVGEAARVQAREEATHLKEDFLSAAAHDLRTPLTVVLAQAELLERRLARDPNARIDPASVARMSRETRRLGDLVRELLDVQRMEGGGLLGARSNVDLARLVADVCARHADQGTPCGIVDPPDPLIAVIDPLRVEQLLDNLLENAEKYGRGGPIAMRVWVEDGEARVSVTDSGIGIAAAELPRIFERFYRGSNVDDRRHAGMGLGLFICRRIVEEHGGRIWAESEAGQGTTFHVALPLEPAVPPAMIDVTSHPAATTEAGPIGSATLPEEGMVADA
jgi:signal transduction histidine kinase